MAPDNAYPLTAVIAEDEALLAEDLAAELERHGIDVVARARTPDEAVDATVRHAPWLVVLDVELEGGSGIDAARRLRAHDGRRCVFLSGRLDGPTRLAINRLDPIAVLSKPLLGSQLLDVVTHLHHVGGAVVARPPTASP